MKKLHVINKDDIDILYEGAIDILKEDFDEEQEAKKAKEESEEKTEEERRQAEKTLLRFFTTALRLDLARLLTAADNIARAIDLKSLVALVRESPLPRFKENWTVLEEQNLMTIQTPAGKVLVGGKGDNIYKEEAVIILDIGGDDHYLNRAGGSNRENPFTIVIDFSGNDVFENDSPAASREDSLTEK